MGMVATFHRFSAAATSIWNLIIVETDNALFLLLPACQMAGHAAKYPFDRKFARKSRVQRLNPLNCTDDCRSVRSERCRLFHKTQYLLKDNGFV